MGAWGGGRLIRPENPGLYALASLNGASFERSDLRALGLEEDAAGRVGVGNFVMRGVEGFEGEGSFGFLRSDTMVLGFSGFLDEPEELAAALGYCTDVPQVELAAAAIERYGSEAPTRMIGEWSFVRWDIAARALTLVTSEACRDPLYFATDGTKVAVSPAVMRLADLPWVGRTLIPENFALKVGRGGLRTLLKDKTIWRGVLQVQPQTTERVAASGRKTTRATDVEISELWQGSFEEAVEQIDVLGRRMIRQHLERGRKTSILLSGGLDSTLIACWVAQEMGPGREAFCVSSVAPFASGLADEREFSSAVADRLGMEIEYVCPAMERSAYLPDAVEFLFRGEPCLDVRHYLSGALGKAGIARGAYGRMSGGYGELTVTDKTPLPDGSAWPERMARQARRWLKASMHRQGRWPGDGFHARLAPDLAATLPDEWEAGWRACSPKLNAIREPDQIGIRPGLGKIAPVATSLFPGIREMVPFRDRRLMRLVSGMPISYLHEGGVTRSLARHILKGRVPDTVRLRIGGRPFSPDYEFRLQQQAREALKRVELYRETGVDEFLDVEWLAGKLSQIGTNGEPMEVADAFAVQLTACVAEFLIFALA